MLKQKKRLKYKFKAQKISIKPKTLYRFKKSLSFNPYFINPTFQELIISGNTLQNKIKTQLNIRVTPNNVFCTFKDIIVKKTLILSSAGKYKLKVSKKTLKFSNKIIVQNFLEEIQRHLEKETIIIKLEGPIKIRKSILKQMTNFLKLNKLIINAKEKKCFNGCRPQKKRRKKQKGLRIFK